MLLRQISCDVEEAQKVCLPTTSRLMKINLQSHVHPRDDKLFRRIKAAPPVQAKPPSPFTCELGRSRFPADTQAIEQPFGVKRTVFHTGCLGIAENVVHAVSIELTAHDIHEKAMLRSLFDDVGNSLWIHIMLA